MSSCYLVTGAAGFIGSHLVEKLLYEGYRVVGLDNFNDFYAPRIKERNIEGFKNHPRFSLLRGDIRNKLDLKKTFEKHDIHCVIHLAAMAGVRPSIEQPLLYNEVNITGTLNLLELMIKHDVKKLIFASSSSVYGNNIKVPFKETDVVDYAISPYAATKKSGEIICHSYHHLYDIDMVLLRFFTVYGPRQRPDLAIHKFTKMIDNGVSIPFYGDGTTQRDYTYIDDIIDGLTKSINYVESHEKVYQIFNLGESQTISLKEMVETLEEMLDKKAAIDKLPMQAGDVERTYADIEKAQRVLRYNPQTSFKHGIEKFIKWYKNQPNS